SDNRIQTFTIGRPENHSPPYLLANNFFLLDSVGSNAGVGGSVDSRGLQFSPDGQQMFLVNRRPPSLQVYDTSLNSTGVPRNTLTGATDICRQASMTTVLGTGDNERAYVTCFTDGEVYIVDPRGQADVEDIISVGRGPYAIAAASLKDAN